MLPVAASVINTQYAHKLVMDTHRGANSDTDVKPREAKT